MTLSLRDPVRRRRVLLAAVVVGAAALGACQPVPTPAATTAAASGGGGAATTPLLTCPYWRGFVVPADHNYAGIGAFTGSSVFMCKDTPTQGVRAHLQHLRNYADGTSTPYTLGNPFEPRTGYTEANFTTFKYHGAAPLWIDLNGKWAVPGTTYAQRIVESICNDMRVSAGLLPDLSAATLTIMGPSELTAVQIGAHVRAKINIADWKPEITVEEMAQIYIDEGNAVGVRGDIAFCQSILETGWFRWPGKPAVATLGVTATDEVLDTYFELLDTTERN